MDRLPFRATPLASPYEGIGTLPVAILLDNVRSMYNVGSFFRTADAAAAEKLLLTGITACPPQPAIRKTALGAEETVRWEHAPDPLPLLDQLREQNYQIAAIETTPHAVDLFEWQPGLPGVHCFRTRGGRHPPGSGGALRRAHPHSHAGQQTLAERGDRGRRGVV